MQQDANHNVTALVNTSGVVVERFAYDPYGKATAYSPTWTELTSSGYGWQYLHQGGRYVSYADSGLYQFRLRDYSPTLGRWVQRDPIEYAAGDSNLYGYVGSRPVTALDPSGLEPEIVAEVWTSPRKMESRLRVIGVVRPLESLRR